MTSADQPGVYLTHEEHAALLAERDALRNAQSYTYIGKNGKPILARNLEDQRDALLAERDRLREALEEAENAPDPDHHCPSFRHVMDVIGAALKGDQI